jgi:hypothetical protein
VRRALTAADAPLRHRVGRSTVLAITVATFTAMADHVVAVAGDLRRDPR